jgi:hypothetical protein
MSSILVPSVETKNENNVVENEISDITHTSNNEARIIPKMTLKQKMLSILNL